MSNITVLVMMQRKLNKNAPAQKETDFQQRTAQLASATNISEQSAAPRCTLDEYSELSRLMGRNETLATLPAENTNGVR